MGLRGNWSSLHFNEVPKLNIKKNLLLDCISDLEVLQLVGSNFGNTTCSVSSYLLGF